MKKLLLAAALAATALVPLAGFAQPAPSAAMPAIRNFGPWGVDLSARDATVKPGDSFFDHVNGGWYSKAVIAGDLPMAGVAVDTYNLTQAQLRSVIEDAAKSGGSPTATKIGALYASYMDEARLEQLDDAPLQRDLARLKAIPSKADFAEHMGSAGSGFHSSLFGFQILPDFKGPKIYTAAIGPGGMGLPNRDYYLDAKFKPQLDAYAAHVARTLALAGWPDPEGSARAIMAFETKIAEASWTSTEQRDLVKIYKPMTAAQLAAHAPGFEWTRFLDGLGNPRFEKVIVTQDTAFPKITALYAATPLATLKAWQAFRITSSAAPYLSQRFVDNNFAFQKALSGTQQMRPRWNRGVANVDAILGEALGQIYVHRHFPAESKRQMEEMVKNLQAAMRTRIEKASWMSPATRIEALRKLDGQRVKVGYPDKWRDYTALQIDSQDLYGNIERAMAFNTRYNFGRLGQPVDREEWGMTPQTLNAYNNLLGNEIVFPAAYLQAPMFDPKADAAVNYGAIGAVIGHEISHGFDDQGRQFDAKGELRNWWAPQDDARFRAEAAKLAAQYDQYEGAPGMKVNGKLTLGENIGDQGGVLLAHDAYKRSLAGRAAPVLGGYSGDQRFFMAWSQGWQQKVRDDMAKMLVVSDVHSPARWRVDGTLRNIDAWYAAFGVKPGDKLYLAPRDRVRVW
jgi:putative endopeptidase